MHFRIVILLLFISFSIVAQEKSKHYVTTKTSYMQGVVNFLSDTKIEIATGGSAKVLTPDDVIEFTAFSNDVYGVITENGTKKFAKRVTGGKVSLFESGDHFFLKKDSVDYALTSADYKQQLVSTLDCNTLPAFPFKQKSIRSAVDQYNKSGCKVKYVPKLKFGVLAGVHMYKLSVLVSETIASKIESKGTAPAFGVFVDFPLYRPLPLSISTEMRLTKMTAESKAAGGVTTEYSAFMIPVGLKWNYLITEKVRGFVKPSMMFAKQKGRSQFDNLDIQGFASNLSVTSFGYELGSGVEFSLAAKLGLYTEVKHSHINTSGGDFMEVGYSSTSVTLGVSF